MLHVGFLVEGKEQVLKHKLFFSSQDKAEVLRTTSNAFFKAYITNSCEVENEKYCKWLQLILLFHSCAMQDNECSGLYTCLAMSNPLLLSAI